MLKMFYFPNNVQFFFYFINVLIMYNKHFYINKKLFLYEYVLMFLYNSYKKYMKISKYLQKNNLNFI